MPNKSKEATYDGELAVKIPPGPSFVEKIRTNLQIGALVVPKTSSFPMMSRILVKFGDDVNPERAQAVCQVVQEMGDELFLQILEFKEEDKKKLNELLDEALKPKPAAPPPAAAPVATAASTRGKPLSANYPKEGKLGFDFPEAMRRKHHEGHECLTQDPNPFQLLIELNANRFTGRVALEAADKSITHVFFRDGRIIGARRTPVDESLTVAYLLRRSGRLSEADYREVRHQREETHKSDEELLSTRAATQDIQVMGVKATKTLVGKACAQRELKHRIEEGAQHVAGFPMVALNLRRTLFGAMLEASARNRNEELVSGLDPYMSHYVERAATLPFSPAELSWEHDEQRFWDVTLAKPIRLRNLFAVSALSKLQSLRHIYAMHFMGLVDFTTHVRPEESKVVEHLKHALDEMKEVNYFEALQVHWTALRPGIDTAYERSRKNWEKLEIPPEKEAEARPLLKQILEKLREVHDYLADDGRRRLYRDKFVEQNMRDFTASLFAEHTKAGLFRGNTKTALYYIEMALDLNPKSQEYRDLHRQCGGRS